MTGLEGTQWLQYRNWIGWWNFSHVLSMGLNKDSLLWLKLNWMKIKNDHQNHFHWSRLRIWTCLLTNRTLQSSSWSDDQKSVGERAKTKVDISLECDCPRILLKIFSKYSPLRKVMHTYYILSVRLRNSQKLEVINWLSITRAMYCCIYFVEKVHSLLVLFSWPLWCNNCVYLYKDKFCLSFSFNG